MSEQIDWDPIRALAHRVLSQGQPLELTEETRALLRRSAREVALPSGETETALRSPSASVNLLEEIRQRIRDGSNRLGDALLRAYALRDEGNLGGARQQLEELLSVEVVPTYRQQAQDALDDIDAGKF